MGVRTMRQRIMWPSLDNIMYEKPVIINPVSGNDSIKVARHLEKSLGNEGFHYYITKEKGDSARFIAEKLAAAEKADKMLLALVVGGDGTCNEIINANYPVFFFKQIFA